MDLRITRRALMDKELKTELNYRKDFERCFEWIDLHLKENITVHEMANVMGYSLYHFCRIFYAYQGLTPMEYVLIEDCKQH